MRNKLLIAVTLLATLISPAVTVAEPDTLAKKTVSDNSVVENVQVTMNSKVGKTQDEIAQDQINENLQKIEEQKKAEAAKAEADRVAAEEAAKVVVYAQKAVVIADGNNSDAIAYGQARNAAVFGDDQWSALFQLWSNESGWRDTAVNYGSGACGIPQFISGCVVGDHVSQIDRGLVYIQSRYGTPAGALAFWNSHRWY